MADAAQRRMTVDEFLVWNGDTDVRYELVDGQPVAMAPVSDAHGWISGQLSGRIYEALRQRSGCGVRLGLGLRSRRRPQSFFIPDLVVSCEPIRAGQQELEQPILVIEILSDSTEQIDRSIKLPDYQLIPGLQEIALIDPRRVHAEVHRLVGEDRWLVHLLRTPDSRLILESVGIDLRLGELYAGIPVD
jgi:Uma2 family endonuclease